MLVPPRSFSVMSAVKEKGDASSLEKGVAPVGPIASHSNSNYVFNAADLDRVQRRLQQRHIQMYVVCVCAVRDAHDLLA